MLTDLQIELYYKISDKFISHLWGYERDPTHDISIRDFLSDKLLYIFSSLENIATDSELDSFLEIVDCVKSDEELETRIIDTINAITTRFEGGAHGVGVF